MAHRTISDDELLTRALELFRTFGFEGVSLKQLAEATGLEKASLYYRFPGGKDEIAMAVVTWVAGGMQQLIFDPLATGGGTARRRVQLICERLREFYGCGLKSCVFDLMSIPGASQELKEALRATMQAWLDAFAAVAKEAGISGAQARARAEEAITRIEGGLVLSRVMGDGAPFERALKAVPELLGTA
ncbi:transcriptional regulator, TetR family [Bryocella elongata]|uniref:Transcriptional regulator, TetR family n=1 Tax=Bryocella elongata TaxID=863522 RepID=A0A1H5SMB5_9BACT|nr:TetR/AcrR family transcriptional regulator [Bryocella elongata]SEF51655.1 transcriptional regulator, TetR family [Bryocella elongata]